MVRLPVEARLRAGFLLEHPKRQRLEHPGLEPARQEPERGLRRPVPQEQQAAWRLQGFQRQVRGSAR